MMSKSRVGLRGNLKFLALLLASIGCNEPSLDQSERDREGITTKIDSVLSSWGFKTYTSYANEPYRGTLAYRVKFWDRDSIPKGDSAKGCYYDVLGNKILGRALVLNLNLDFTSREPCYLVFEFQGTTDEVIFLMDSSSEYKIRKSFKNAKYEQFVYKALKNMSFKDISNFNTIYGDFREKITEGEEGDSLMSEYGFWVALKSVSEFCADGAQRDFSNAKVDEVTVFFCASRGVLKFLGKEYASDEFKEFLEEVLEECNIKELVLNDSFQEIRDYVREHS